MLFHWLEAPSIPVGYLSLTTSKTLKHIASLNQIWNLLGICDSLLHGRQICDRERILGNNFGFAARGFRELGESLIRFWLAVFVSVSVCGLVIWRNLNRMNRTPVKDYVKPMDKRPPTIGT